MEVLIVAVLNLLIGGIFGWQNQYIIYQENVTLDYVNKAFADITVQIYKLNQTTNGLKFTFLLKKPIPADTKVSIRGFRWMNDDYRLGILQLDRTLSRTLEMETFDIESLCMHYTRPQFTWPLQTGITYRSAGWSPDSSKYPPNAPGGKWKVILSISHGNNVKIAVLSWYIQLIYK